MQEEREQNTQENTEEQTSGYGCLKMAIAVIIGLLIIGLIFYVTTQKVNNSNSNNDSDTGVFERLATNSDIQIDQEYSFPISIKIIIVANVDINNLSLKLVFTDKAQNPLKTMTKPIGNIRKGERKEIILSLTDFSWDEIWTISYVLCTVSGGTVSVFS